MHQQQGSVHSHTIGSYILLFFIQSCVNHDCHHYEHLDHYYAENYNLDPCDLDFD
jgi:hypothetical protein